MNGVLAVPLFLQLVVDLTVWPLDFALTVVMFKLALLLALEMVQTLHLQEQVEPQIKLTAELVEFVTHHSSVTLMLHVPVIKEELIAKSMVPVSAV